MTWLHWPFWWSSSERDAAVGVFEETDGKKIINIDKKEEKTFKVYCFKNCILNNN